MVALAAGLSGSAVKADSPQRVVSLNLCTDQLAMMLASNGQLLSVSPLASDPRSSAMVEAAKAFPINHAQAEEIYLMRPDLVLAGRYTARATVEMLTRLGVPVAIFDPANSLEDVASRLTQMGEALGREDRAADAITDYRARLAKFQAKVGRNPRAALYAANGYTSGDRTLAGQILLTAGFANVAAEAGYAMAGTMPLEVLALAQPDAVITSRPYPGGSRAEEIMDHPLVQAMRTNTASFTDHDWVCGTPFVLRAIGNVAKLRQELEAE
ncbi:ABC transporter substrate-binding protein (plasmid) [Pseudorhodobacter turbinis]|uniref:ABC transporter substrate-binding protein n=2 Tax=Pseudorhodobacter turbinis TaxID=2500533 RepID=A0A4P8ELV5_9RHOB|nr:ABC transporter substrate-binding protein [Pseudorhodobacter turbinis]